MNKQELIKKMKALADSGVGGDKNNVQKSLKELMLKYNIKEEEITKLSENLEKHEYLLQLQGEIK